MALTFELKKESTLAVDLNNESGIHVLGGYTPAVATPRGDGTLPDYVTEIVPVHIKPTSDDNMAALVQGIVSAQKAAAEYWVDPTQGVEVWLHQQLTAESGERRALVRSIHFAWDPQVGGVMDGPPDITEGRHATLTIVRHPYWERQAHRSFIAGTPSAAAAVMWDYYGAGTVVGDVGARIDELRWQCNTNGQTLDKIWIGFRSAKHGTVANFVPIWECEDGTNVGARASDDAASETNLASPGGGSGVYVDGTPSGDDTWEKYFDIQLANVTANHTDNFGRFLWLLRCKCEGADTYQIRLRFGYNAMLDGDYRSGPIKQITHTDWNFVEMGEQAIPLLDLNSFSVLGGTQELTWTVQVWAKRLAGGAGSGIFFDCFCPIPIDEGYFFSDDCDGVYQYPVRFGETPKGRYVSVTATTGSRYSKIPPPSAFAFRLPIGTGQAVAAYQRASESVLTDAVDFANSNTGRFFECWTALRGAE
jgi:hypothetical protein